MLNLFLVLLATLLISSTVRSESNGCVNADCQNGECVTSDPRYPNGYCQCDWGYRKSEFDSLVCFDRDECAMTDKLVCGGGLCRNTKGGYYCECFRGYVPTLYRTYCQL